MAVKTKLIFNMTRGEALCVGEMADSPLPIVVLSAHVAKGSEQAAAALAAGALDVVAKDTLRLDRLK